MSRPIENSHQDKGNSVMLTHLMKVRTEITQYYNTIKDDFHKVWLEETIYKTDADPPHDI